MGVSNGSRKDRLIRDVYETIKFVIFMALAVWVINTFLFVAYRVEGTSMDPTIHDKDMLVIDKSAIWMDRLDRFDIVVFHNDKKDDYVKRIIGLPGDEITYENDVLYVNGNRVPEKYLVEELGGKPENGVPFTGNFSIEDLLGSKKVPKDQYFVLGDNRMVSKDSRMIGFVKKEKMVGAVSLRFFPFNTFSTLR